MHSCYNISSYPHTTPSNQYIPLPVQRLGHAQGNMKEKTLITVFPNITLRNIKQSVQFNIKKSPFVLKKNAFQLLKKDSFFQEVNLIPLFPPSGYQAGPSWLPWHWSWQLNIFCCYLPHSTNLRLYLKHYPSLPKTVSTLVKRTGCLAQKQRRLTVDVLESQAPFQILGSPLSVDKQLDFTDTRGKVAGVCFLCMSVCRVHRSAGRKHVWICTCDTLEVTRSKMGKDISCFSPGKVDGKSTFMSLIQCRSQELVALGSVALRGRFNLYQSRKLRINKASRCGQLLERNLSPGPLQCLTQWKPAFRVVTGRWRGLLQPLATFQTSLCNFPFI